METPSEFSHSGSQGAAARDCKLGQLQSQLAGGLAETIALRQWSGRNGVRLLTSVASTLLVKILTRPLDAT